MTANHVLQQIWAARLIDAFDKQIIWGSVLEDRSAEIVGARSLHINELTTTITVGDYTVDSNINAAQVITDTDAELVLDKQKYFHLYVDDIHQSQSRAPLLAKTTQMGSQKAAEQFDADALTAVTAAIPSGNKTTQSAVAFTEAGGKSLAYKILEQVEEMDSDNMPPGERFCVIPTNVKRALLIYLIERQGGSGADSDGALHEAALSRLLGMTVRVDTQMATSAGSGRYLAIMGHRSGVQFARTIQNVETYRPELRFGDAVKGLFVYGHKTVKDDRLWAVTQS